ncbi:hypothetical protein JL722_868 [Aureococcus anophagefferens]|nr:hypothetical protein JL722_868 [Aureococcus anophagefferens]
MTEERAKAQATEEVARILGATRGEEPCDAVQRHAAASGRWLVDALRSAAPPAPPATLLRLLRKTSQLRLRSALPDDDARPSRLSLNAFLDATDDSHEELDAAAGCRDWQVSSDVRHANSRAAAQRGVDALDAAARKRVGRRQLAGARFNSRRFREDLVPGVKGHVPRAADARGRVHGFVHLLRRTGGACPGLSDLAGCFGGNAPWAYALNDCTNLDLEHIAAFCGLSILLGGAEGDAREHAICACSAFAAAPEAVDALLAWFALTPRIGRTEEPPEGPHPWSDLFLGDDGTPAVPELFDYVLSDTPVPATPAQLTTSMEYCWIMLEGAARGRDAPLRRAATVAASAHLPGFLDRLLEFVFLSFEDPNPPGVAGLAAKVGLSATEAPLLSIGEIAARCLVALCQRVPAAVAPLRAAYARATIKEDGGARVVNAMFVFFRTQYDGRWNLSPVGSRGYVFLSLYRRAALDGPPPPRLRSCMACGRDEACARCNSVYFCGRDCQAAAHGMHKLYCSTDRFVRIRDGDAEEHASQTRVTGSRRSSHAMAKHMPKIAAELGMPWEEILENAKAETMAKMPWRGRQAAAKAIMAKMPGGASESYKSPQNGNVARTRRRDAHA